jgi:hypothetical protein
VNICNNREVVFAGIFTKVNQQKDPSAPPVPEPDNGEERLQLLKKEVVFPSHNRLNLELELLS